VLTVHRVQIDGGPAQDIPYMHLAVRWLSRAFVVHEMLQLSSVVQTVFVLADTNLWLSCVHGQSMDHLACSLHVCSSLHRTTVAATLKRGSVVSLETGRLSGLRGVSASLATLARLARANKGARLTRRQRNIDARCRKEPHRGARCQEARCRAEDACVGHNHARHAAMPAHADRAGADSIMISLLVLDI
jgi:hypothetical protein